MKTPGLDKKSELFKRWSDNRNELAELIIIRFEHFYVNKKISKIPPQWVYKIYKSAKTVS